MMEEIDQEWLKQRTEEFVTTGWCSSTFPTKILTNKKQTMFVVLPQHFPVKDKSNQDKLPVSI